MTEEPHDRERHRRVVGARQERRCTEFAEGDHEREYRRAQHGTRRERDRDVAEGLGGPRAWALSIRSVSIDARAGTKRTTNGSFGRF